MTEQINSEIIDVVDSIRNIADVKKVILFHKKHSVSGKLSGFKICAVIETLDKKALEKKIYRDIDSEIPFDVVIYTPDEWEDLSQENGTFAHKITMTGCDLID